MVAAAHWPRASPRKACLVKQHESSSFVRQHYTVVRRLGKGTFGHIDMVRDRATGEQRVCKVISTAGMHPHVLQMMRKEVEVLTVLDHPNIVRLFEWAEDQSNQELIMILEYVPHGDCLRLLRANVGALPEDLVAGLVRQLLEALLYCHASGVAHRDVKPENMVLTKAASDSPDVKVIDFGLATSCEGASHEMAGTVPYLAPEVAVNQGGYSPAADIWSVGVTTFELLAGISPFGKPEDHRDNAAPVLERLCKYRNFSDLFEVLQRSPGWARQTRSTAALDFLAQLLSREPEARPTAADALRHPWLQQHPSRAAGLQADVIRSLASYSNASPDERACLFAVAAKGASSTRERFAQCFLAADADRDGQLSRQDLAAALKSKKFWWSPEVNLEALFQAADPNETGLLSFTEFVAACMCGSPGMSGAELAESAFQVLDHDRDWLLSAQDLGPLFQELPAGLPLGKPFGLGEWKRCMMEQRQQPARAVLDAGRALRPGLLGRWLWGCQLRQDDGSTEVEILETPQWERQLATPRRLQSKDWSPRDLSPGPYSPRPPSPPRWTPEKQRGPGAPSRMDLSLSPWTVAAKDPAAKAAAAAAMAAVAMAFGPPDPVLPSGPHMALSPPILPLQACVLVTCN